MKLTPRRVTALWRREPALRAAFHEVRRALGIKKSQSIALKSVLDGLVQEGLLRLHANHYRLTDSTPVEQAPQPENVPGSPPKRSDAPSRREEATEEYTGVFSAHRDGYGFIAIGAGQPNLFIPPRRVGGALDGDLVRAGLVRRRGEDRLSGHILEVMERRRASLRGTVQFNRGEAWVTPLNEKIPSVYVEQGSGKLPTAGRVVEVNITEYPEDVQTAPMGRILREIDNPESPEAIMEYILSDLQLPTEFSPQTLDAAQKLAKARPASAGKKRRDLTELPFVTIDGADARDFDDAVCLEKKEQGGFHLWVSIADVAEFVRPGEPLEIDAYARGTSVYFPARVVPMLPEELSNDLCSLRPHESRLTLTCEMEIDALGAVTAHEVYESTIRSQARLTYDGVRDFLQGDEAALPAEARKLGDMLREMLALSLLLAQKRSARGSLDFSFPEARFELTEEGLPNAIIKKYPSSATRLIEQFMLEANETVARHCTEEGIATLHRVHDPPPPDQAATACEQLKILGVGATPEEFLTPEGVNRILARAASHPAREQVEVTILKGMSQAQYRPLGEGHFGLAATHYTHFTSPIRRFPDLLVHRALKDWLRGRPPQNKGLPPLPAVGMHLSERERAAAEAEGRVHKLYRVLLMEKHLGEVFPAVISGITNRGLWVTLDEPFVEGFLPLAALPIKNYEVDARRNIMRGARGGKEVTMGKKLTVQLARAVRLSQELEFSFIQWDWEGKEESENITENITAKKRGKKTRVH